MQVSGNITLMLPIIRNKQLVLTANITVHPVGSQFPGVTMPRVNGSGNDGGCIAITYFVQ